jgi:hypothetical protein
LTRLASSIPFPIRRLAETVGTLTSKRHLPVEGDQTVLKRNLRHGIR